MEKDMFDISDDAWGMPQKAVKEFTDREDPQEAFERKFRVLNENWKKSYYVLCYYGIGGIGKTSFVNKLCRVIRGVEGNEPRLLDKIECNYIRYDFEAKTSGIDKLSILLSLRKQLGEADKNFKFFRFDSAVLLYAKKSGSSIEKDETAQSLLEGNPWLDAVISTVGTVPVVGWVSGVIQAIDKSSRAVKEAISKHMDEAKYRYHLNEIDCMEMPEILGKLHEYFIMDMRYNMQYVATKPVIVFLDTYERYIDTLNREISMITEDHWLRKGNRSVIRSIPGILWVITGREKLFWAEDDAWDEPKVECPFSQMDEKEKEELAEKHLEQHLLGDLSLKDATGFLKKAGISNDTICRQIYDLTNGTPLFLDICVDSYHDLCGRGISIEIEQFGEDLTQLISRYLSNMNDANREMVYFLACLGTWNDESVREIAKKATTLRWYTYAKYEDFVKHSFIIKNLDGSFYMHETVRSAALKNADKEILNDIRMLKMSMLKERLTNDTTLDYTAVLSELIKVLKESDCSYEVFYECLVIVKRGFRQLSDAGCLDLLYRHAKEILCISENRYPETLVEDIARSEYGAALCLKGYVKAALKMVEEISWRNQKGDEFKEDWIIIKSIITNVYDANGLRQECLELTKDIVDFYKHKLGEEHEETINAMNNLVAFYGSVGEIYKALEMSKKILEISKQKFGLEHLCTIRIMNNVAVSYIRIGEYEKAQELGELILETSTKALGEENPNTLSIMNNVAVIYDSVGENQKALKLCEQMLETSKRALGEKHPITIRTMYNLASSYYSMRERKVSLKLFEQVFEMRKQILGEDHPDTLKAMNSLASAYYSNNNLQRAHELYEQALVESRRILGENHPDTIKVMKDLALFYYYTGEVCGAIELCEQISELRSKK